MTDLLGYFAYAANGDRRWGPPHLERPRRRTVQLQPDPEPEPEIEGGEELARQVRDWLTHVEDLAARRHGDRHGDDRSQTDRNHAARMRALQLAWEKRGIPWNPTIAEGYLRHHPWEPDGLETRGGGECWVR